MSKQAACGCQTQKRVQKVYDFISVKFWEMQSNLQRQKAEQWLRGVEVAEISEGHQGEEATLGRDTSGPYRGGGAGFQRGRVSTQQTGACARVLSAE